MSNRPYLTISPLGALLSLVSTLLYLPLISEASLPAWVLLLLVNFVHVSLLYVLASQFQTRASGEWFRGGLIGLNAGLNGLFIHLQWNLPGPAVAVTALLFASAFLFVSRSRVYHMLVGWTNWFMPMSWIINGVGLLFFLVNLLLAPLSLLGKGWERLGVRIYLEPHTSTCIMYGGGIRALAGFNGFNMGNFVFINPGSEYLLKHEIGHLLSLAVMGSAFHLIGGIDEACIQLRYWEAYAEYLAESYNHPTRSSLSMWK